MSFNLLTMPIGRHLFSSSTTTYAHIKPFIQIRNLGTIHYRRDRRQLSTTASASSTMFQYNYTEAFYALHEFIIRGFEATHYYTGLPWPATIAVFTLATRAALFPLTVRQLRGNAHMALNKGEITRQNAVISELRKEGRKAEANAKLSELTQFMADNGCNPAKLFIYTLIPAPIYIMMFMGIRAMSTQPLPGFLEEGVAWLPSLSVADPYFILPTMSTVMILTSMEIARSMSPVATPALLTNLFRMAALFSFPAFAFMPSSLMIYMLSTNVFTLGTNLMWRSRRIKELFGIPWIAPSKEKAPSLYEEVKRLVLGAPKPPAQPLVYKRIPNDRKPVVLIKATQM